MENNKQFDNVITGVTVTHEELGEPRVGGREGWTDQRKALCRIWSVAHSSGSGKLRKVSRGGVGWE